MNTSQDTHPYRAATFPRVEDSELLLQTLCAEIRPGMEAKALGKLESDVIRKCFLSDIADETVYEQLLIIEENVEESGVFKSVQWKLSSDILSQIPFGATIADHHFCAKPDK